MPTSDALTQEIEQNFEFFQTKLGDLIKDHRGRYALLRRKEIVGIFDTLRDAKLAGDTTYSDGIFSIQEVTNAEINLGIYSYAVHLGTAQ